MEELITFISAIFFIIGIIIGFGLKVITFPFKFIFVGVSAVNDCFKPL